MARNPGHAHEGEATFVRDRLNRQIVEALGALRATRKATDEDVHTARKKLKQARAGVRLLRAALSPRTTQRANVTLRDAARPLSAARDAKVLLDATGSLIKVERNRAARSTLARLRRTLSGERREAWQELRRGAKGLAHIVQSLENAAIDTARLRLENDHRAGLRASLKRIYRQGRKAMRACDAACSDENLHEARKQVKYLSAALKCLAEIGAFDAGRLTKCADSIADDLGVDHDLAVLQAKIAALAAPSGRADAAIASRIARRRARLQKKALQAARELYRAKPAAFVADL